MKLKNINYNKCLTNLTCSILKYFNCEYRHNTLKYIDKILNERKPKNVIYILCDGMGYNITKRILSKDSFIIKNIKYKLLSVFPPTTTAATTSILTGLNPNEHCWLGWNIYMKEIDEVVTMYLNKIKDTDTLIGNENICNKYLGYTSIIDSINKRENSYAKTLYPFGEDKYLDFDDMLLQIKCNMNKKDMNFIYAYCDNPDFSMHEYGTKDQKSIGIFNMINEKLEKFCTEVGNSIIFITADHGHIDSDYYYLEDYPDLFQCLKRDISGESRSPIFFVKNGMKNEFKQLFKKYFGKYFILLSRKQILDNKIYGNGITHPHFHSSIGDYIAISISNKNINYKRSTYSYELKSSHAGNTNDETIVPLIIIDKTVN